MTTKNKDDILNAVKEMTDITNDVKNILNVSYVKKMFRIGSESFDAFEPFIDKPTLYNAARSLFGVGKILVNDAEIYGHSFFDDEGWIDVYGHEFRESILQSFAKMPYSTLRTNDENTFIKIVEVDGVKFGWTDRVKQEFTAEPVYVLPSQLIRAKEIISKLFWEKFSGHHIVFKATKQHDLGGRGTRCVFDIDNVFDAKTSEQANEYSNYLKRCINANVHRSVMLYGPPGTGKSTMARTIVNNLELKSLRIRVEDIGGLENGTLQDAITIFKPDALILDDFDRAGGQSSLLESLEFFQKNVKLVIATVNNMHLLDVALLRPGRFDELVLVEKMDSKVIKHILGEYSDGFEDVQNWPVAFIQEYVKRRRFMNEEEAARSMLELSERVENIKNRNDRKSRSDDDWEDLNLHSNKKKKAKKFKEIKF